MASITGRLSPISETLYRSVAFPLARRLTRRASYRVLLELRESERAPLDALRHGQDERVRAIVRWAYDTVPAHRRRFEEAGVRPEEIRGVDDLARLPILTKRDLQTRGAAFHSRRIGSERHWTFPTSGATGEPLLAVRDVALRAIGQGTYWHALEWWGLHPADSTLDITSRPRNVNVDSFLHALAGARRVIVRAAAGTDPRDHARLQAVLEDWGPRSLSGSPARLTALARAVLEGNVRLRRMPSAVVYYGAVMTGEQRDVVARAFRAPIHSRYAAAEFVPPIAYTCEHGWFHVNVHHLHVEIVDGGRADRTGRPAKEGRVIVSDLTNFAAPALRYEVGDLAAWGSEDRCPCGRTWPRLASIGGRHIDALTTPSGRRIPASTLFHMLYARMPEFADVVWEFQFRQHASHEIELCIVPRPTFTAAHAKALEAALASATGGELRGRVTAVDDIPVGPGDKRPLLLQLAAADAAMARHAP